jgi:uncharacterized protein with GYD domain
LCAPGTRRRCGAKERCHGRGSSRRSAIEKIAAELGGHLETFDFDSGKDDVDTIVELPDNKAAAAVALAVNSTGHTSVRTVVLMTPRTSTQPPRRL